MAGDVVNNKICIPLKLCSGLTGNYHAICHYSYNLPLCVSLKTGHKETLELQNGEFNRRHKAIT
jgi:hypothetical protein